VRPSGTLVKREHRRDAGRPQRCGSATSTLYGSAVTARIRGFCGPHSAGQGWSIPEKLRVRAIFPEDRSRQDAVFPVVESSSSSKGATEEEEPASPTTEPTVTPA